MIPNQEIKEDLEEVPPIVIDKKSGQPESSDIQIVSIDSTPDNTNRPPAPTDYISIREYLRSLKGLRHLI